MRRPGKTFGRGACDVNDAKEETVTGWKCQGKRGRKLWQEGP